MERWSLICSLRENHNTIYRLERRKLMTQAIINDVYENIEMKRTTSKHQLY